MIDSFPNINAFNGIVVFILGGKEFCLDVAKVSAIIKPDQLDEYYHVYSQSKSMLKQCKNTIPLADLMNVLGSESKSITSESRIILIDCSFIIIGFLVEKIKEIITMDIQCGKKEFKFVPLEGNTYIRGVFIFEGRNIIILNIEEICSGVFNSLDLLPSTPESSGEFPESV